MKNVQTDFRMRVNTPFVRAAGLAVGIALNTTTSASVVIHDSTWMTDQQSYNAFVSSSIAAPEYGGPIWDHNAASNFTVSSAAYQLTGVSGDFIAVPPGPGWGGEGVLVEIFADTGDGAPSNSPTAQFFATEGNGLTVEHFADTVFGTPKENALRFNVDVSNEGFTLTEGSWWMSIVPVHESDPSWRYVWLRQEGLQSGGELHVRKGSEAHGNNYGGTIGTFEWAPISDQLFQPPGDTAFAVTGAIIPAPGVLSLLGLAGMSLRSRRRS